MLQFLPATKLCLQERSQVEQFLKRILSQEAAIEVKNQNNLFETPVYQVFAQFLFEVRLFVSYNVFGDVAYFLFVFARFLNSQNPDYCI